MELAISALGAIFKGGATAGATAGASAAGGSVATAAGAGSTGLSIAQGLSTVASIIGTIGAGSAKADSYALQAGSEKLEAQREETAHVRRTTDLKQELLRVLGKNDVSFAAAGIDISGGVAEDARSAAEKRASTEISIDRSDTDARIAARRAAAAGYRRLGKAARRGALLDAAGQAIDFGSSLKQRG
jgi:hypothetical protein